MHFQSTHQPCHEMNGGNAEPSVSIYHCCNHRRHHHLILRQLGVTTITSPVSISKRYLIYLLNYFQWIP